MAYFIVRINPGLFHFKLSHPNLKGKRPGNENGLGSVSQMHPNISDRKMKEETEANFSTAIFIEISSHENNFKCTLHLLVDNILFTYILECTE